MRKALLALSMMILATSSEAAQDLRAGATPAGQPASGVDPAGKWEGISVELLRDMLASSGRKIEFVQMNFADLQAALIGSKVDVIAASFGITPERARVVDFSEPYGSYRDVLMVADSDKGEYRSLAELKGKRIATSRGSAYVNPLRDAAVDLVEVGNPVEAISELRTGHVEGVVDNGLQLRFRSKQMNLTGFRIVEHYPPIAEGKLAFAVRKGDRDLLELLNSRMKEAERNGILGKLKANWSID